jgi:hypothetical protein
MSRRRKMTKSRSYKKSPRRSSKSRKLKKLNKRSKSISKRRISGGACSADVDPISIQPINEIPPLYRLSIPFRPANGVNESIEHCRDLRQLAVEFEHGFTKNQNSQTEYTNDQLIYIYAFISANHVAIYNAGPQESNNNIWRLHQRIFNALVFYCFEANNIAVFDYILVQPTHPILRSLQKSGKWVYNRRYGMPLPNVPGQESLQGTLLNTILSFDTPNPLQRGTRINFLRSLIDNVGITKNDIDKALQIITLENNPYQGKKDAEDVEIVRLLLKTINDNYAFDDETYGTCFWYERFMLDVFEQRAFNIMEYPFEIQIIDLYGQYGFQINPPNGEIWQILFNAFQDDVEYYRPMLNRISGCISQVWIPRGLNVNGLLPNGETPLAGANRLFGPGNLLSQLLIANGGVV